MDTQVTRLGGSETISAHGGDGGDELVGGEGAGDTGSGFARCGDDGGDTIAADGGSETGGN
jgi:hypothetical protein